MFLAIYDVHPWCHDEIRRYTLHTPGHDASLLELDEPKDDAAEDVFSPPSGGETR